MNLNTPSTLTNLAVQERTRREILHRSDLIRPLPEMVVRLLGMLNDGNSEPADIEKHLQVDQVLVAKLLGMVNSPFYGLSRQVRSIREAIVVLGFRGLRSLLLASSTAKFLDRDLGGYGHDQHGLLKHSFCVASAARSLAQFTHQGQDLSEELFIAGLLHDIGKMLLAPYLLQHHLDPHQVATAIVATECATIGIDHTEAGALVAAKWNLSPLVQEVIKHHHDDETPQIHKTAFALVRLADALAHERRIGYQQDCVPETVFFPQDLRTLGLTAQDWARAREVMDEAMSGAVSSMQSLLH